MIDKNKIEKAANDYEDKGYYQDGGISEAFEAGVEFAIKELIYLQEENDKLKVELKSEEIFPKEKRLVTDWTENNLKYRVKGSNQAFCLLENYHKALEAAELEIAKLKATKQSITEIVAENQGLKYMIEKGYGGNCIIAPKEEVDKIAKERYEKAEEYLLYYAGSIEILKEAKKALKIAAGLI